MERLIGHWVINWAWVALIEDHGDKTCTLLKYDRTKTPPEFEQGHVVENNDRHVVAVKVGDEELKVLNVKHVFSYSK